MRILITAVSRFTRPTGICKHAASLARALGTVRGIERVTLLIGPWQVKYFDEAFGATSFPKVSIVPAALDNSSLDRNRLVEENMWRAIRHGLDGRMIDFERGVEYESSEIVERLLAWTAPARAQLS